MSIRGRRFATVLADPPWRFTNKSGKVAPEHKRLARCGTMTLDAIIALPVAQVTAATAHRYLWCPNALLPQGALLFSCNGRGTRLFSGPNHDARTLRELCGPIPLAGFFAQGEFGPVGGRNHIHGFTASVALFEG